MAQALFKVEAGSTTVAQTQPIASKMFPARRHSPQKEQLRNRVLNHGPAEVGDSLRGRDLDQNVFTQNE